MKRSVSLLIGLMVLVSGTLGQNLVPNPSFENNNGIPNSENQFDLVDDWFNPTERTPDYFHLQSPGRGIYSANPLDSGWGAQAPRSGEAYIVLHYYVPDPPTQFEFVSVVLTDTLVPLREYRVRVYASLAETSSGSCDDHGFLFSEGPIYLTSAEMAQLEPTFTNPPFVDDRDAWTPIEFTWIADRPHTVLTIGNFSYGTGSLRLNPGGARQVTYFLDDVSVEATGKFIGFEPEISYSCDQASVRLQSYNVKSAREWDWTVNDDLPLTGPAPELTLTEEGIYEVTLRTVELGQEYLITQSFEVRFPEKPTAQFSLDESLPVDTRSLLPIVNESSPGTHFFWDWGNGEASEGEQPQYRYPNPGYYTVTLAMEDEWGCRDAFSQEIFVACSERLLANAFTPNGDGQNDVFPFDGLRACEEVLIQIYNRSGQLIYESQDPSRPWSGEDYPTDTYYFMVRYRDGQEQGYLYLQR